MYWIYKIVRRTTSNLFFLFSLIWIEKRFKHNTKQNAIFKRILHPSQFKYGIAFNSTTVQNHNGTIKIILQKFYKKIPPKSIETIILERIQKEITFALTIDIMSFIQFQVVKITWINTTHLLLQISKMKMVSEVHTKYTVKMGSSKYQDTTIFNSEKIECL